MSFVSLAEQGNAQPFIDLGRARAVMLNWTDEEA